MNVKSWMGNIPLLHVLQFTFGAMGIAALLDPAQNANAARYSNNASTRRIFNSRACTWCKSKAKGMKGSSATERQRRGVQTLYKVDRATKNRCTDTI